MTSGSAKVAQPELPQPPQGEPAAQPPAGQVAGGLGDQHLPAMRGGLHPGAPVDRRVVGLVAAARPRLPGVQPHPHPQHGPRRPRLTAQPELARAGRLDRGHRAGKDGEHTVPLAAGGDHHPAMVFDDAGHQTVVALQRHLHRLRHALPQPGGTLDIGQQERHRPRRHCQPGLRLGRAPPGLPGRAVGLLLGPAAGFLAFTDRSEHPPDEVKELVRVVLVPVITQLVGVEPGQLVKLGRQLLLVWWTGAID
jgi:hypothetical protein